jgi:hypothetical protein
MENLISTTDFNIQLFERLFTDQIGDASYVDRVVRYAKIMKQPIRKNMFVPCLPDGDIFQTPTPCSKSCSPIDYCVGGKCDIEGCYGNVGRYEEACKTIVFDGWFGFTNSLSKAETGIANEVTNGEFTIYFYKDKFPFLAKEKEGFIGGVRVETIEDLLKSEAKFKLSSNFKNKIGL